MGLGKRRSTLLTIKALATIAVAEEGTLPIQQELFELGRRGEGEQHGQVVELDIGGNEANDELLEALRADFVNKNVYEGGTLAWRLLIKLEKARIVALGERVPCLEGVRHWLR